MKFDRWSLCDVGSECHETRKGEQNGDCGSHCQSCASAFQSAAPIHVDDFADRLVGISDPDGLRDAIANWDTPSAARVCAYFALRQRFAEDQLQRAIARGVRQIILLGAGLDSTALRKPTLAQEVRFVEVDHPDSQAWKLARLRELGLSTPLVNYVSVDFSTERLQSRLEQADVSLKQPTFLSWLGVTQYIARAASDATLALVAELPADSQIVFDFIVRNELLDPLERCFSEAAASKSSARGEPWMTYFDPGELEAYLAALGFENIERLTPRLAASMYYGSQPADVTPLEAWQVISATV